MRFAVIYKERLARSRPAIVEAPSFEALSKNPQLDFIDLVEAVVDFEGRRVIRSGMTPERDILAVVDPEMRQLEAANYAFWFRQVGLGEARTAVVDVESAEKAMQISGLSPFTSKQPTEVWVDMLVDFKEQEVRPVAMKADGSIIEVWDGDFGERTPGEWFAKSRRAKFSRRG